MSWCAEVTIIIASALTAMADLECLNCSSLIAETDEGVLLSLRVSRPAARSLSDEASSLDGTDIFFGMKTVVAFSPQGWYSEENGWYGDKVGYINDLQLMGFQPGGKCPGSFFLRQRVGFEPSGCLRYGEQVVIAQSSDPGETRVCKWYGCKVAGVQDGELAFFAGGTDPQAFYVLPQFGPSDGCVKYGDAVVLSDSPEIAVGTTNVLFNSDDIMSFGPTSHSATFFLRPPACGEGPVDVCNSGQDRFSEAMRMVEDHINQKLLNVTAEKDPLEKTQYWWDIAFTGPIFKNRWTNSAGRKITATDFANANVSLDIQLSECMASGMNATLSASGEVSLKWNDAIGANVEFFYDGFIPFVNFGRKLSMTLSGLKLEALVSATMTTTAGVADSVCLTQVSLSGCAFPGEVVVKGAPNVKATLERRVRNALDSAADNLCSGFSDSENLPRCFSVR